MTTYVLSYDLRGRDETSEDYAILIKELNRLGAHRYQKSAWLIALNNTAQEALDHFKQFIDSDDRLFVCELVHNHAHTRSMQGTTPWIAAHPPSR